MARTKPDKIREESYDFLVEALEKINKKAEGRSKEGLVIKNHLDGEHIVIKVIKKKDPVQDIEPITTYKEKLQIYEESKKIKKGG